MGQQPFLSGQWTSATTRLPLDGGSGQALRGLGVPVGSSGVSPVQRSLRSDLEKVGVREMVRVARRVATTSLTPIRFSNHFSHANEPRQPFDYRSVAVRATRHFSHVNEARQPIHSGQCGPVNLAPESNSLIICPGPNPSKPSLPLRPGEQATDHVVRVVDPGRSRWTGPCESSQCSSSTGSRRSAAEVTALVTG